ncbi:hypothetical protein BS47DRAFT_1339549 [Hydnum rufescens UP504]|uniref:Uncharacterized protein n=1 Tax=Hydnum rufescens UP504 TaxID=1448309 RepID=A0A9P6B4C1_9AGAM|nr:hypothetical protein BS47DRAFT_1339549 [Hydnum rufescens UP504]
MKLGYSVTTFCPPASVIPNLQPLIGDARRRLHSQGEHVERQGPFNPSGVSPSSTWGLLTTSSWSLSGPTPLPTSTAVTSSTPWTISSSSTSSTSSSSSDLTTTPATLLLNPTFSSTSLTTIEVTSQATTDSNSGLCALAIIGFIIWKLKKKRFSGFDDKEVKAIHWPDFEGAAATTHPLPARPTGRAGIEMSPLEPSEMDFDGRSWSDSSIADVAIQAAPPPYALPAPEPAQRYYGHSASGVYPHSGPYYDPYPRPVPHMMSPHQVRLDDRYGARSPDSNESRWALSPGPRAVYSVLGRAPFPDPGPSYATGSSSPGANMGFGDMHLVSPGVYAAHGEGEGGIRGLPRALV